MILFYIFALVLTVHGGKLRTVHEWKYIDYEFVNSQHRQQAILSGEYNYTQCAIIDTDEARDGRKFLTIVKQKGVPASLVTVSKLYGPGGPLVSPYPDWSWASKNDCTGITGVYRVTIDACHRLWVLDTGVVGSDQVCPAQLLVFDLINDQLLRKITIPMKFATSSSSKRGLLVTPVVDSSKDCQVHNVYIADVEGYGLIVYDGTDIWRLESKVFKPDPNGVKFTIAGESFVLEDGILGMDLADKYSPHSKLLYFKPLGSFNQFAISTEALSQSRDKSVTYYKSNYKMPSQSAAQAFSSRGILFFGPTANTSLACWNYKKEFNQDNIVTVAQDEERLQFLSGMKVKRFPRRPEKVLMASNRYQKIMAGTMNFNEVNFRILEGPVQSLIADTNCVPSSNTEGKPLEGFSKTS
ncbi:major royal jelly protein 1 [Cephus cinctus]|uniref:Major royal jelly protein 1 n=1 Tax=Cephus cinctus TaxID=211228 RepID=A0AAJ7BQN5_CEPCN|nr:major royal jelly protein 1 [Cephus cinctus]